MLDTVIIILGIAVVFGWMIFLVKGYEDTKVAGLIKNDYADDEDDCEEDEENE